MNDLGLAKTQPTFDEFTAAVNNCTKIISPVRRKFFTSAFVFIVSICCPVWFTFLVPAQPGSPGQRAVKWVCVCVCVCFHLLSVWLQCFDAVGWAAGRASGL